MPSLEPKLSYLLTQYSEYQEQPHLATWVPVVHYSILSQSMVHSLPISKQYGTVKKRIFTGPYPKLTDTETLCKQYQETVF